MRTAAKGASLMVLDKNSFEQLLGPLSKLIEREARCELAVNWL